MPFTKICVIYYELRTNQIRCNNMQHFFLYRIWYIQLPLDFKRRNYML